MWNRGVPLPVRRAKIDHDIEKPKKKSFVRGVADKIKGWFD